MYFNVKIFLLGLSKTFIFIIGYYIFCEMKNHHFSNLSEMKFDLSKNQKLFLQKIDGICKLLREEEEKSYLKASLNKKVIPFFNKIGMLGCPISKEYGGLGYDILSYLLALERIGEEGSSMRTFFSCHTSIGQMILQNWGTEEQKKKFLPNTTKGIDIMAFALTEPNAGSDPSLIETTFEESGDQFIISGKKHWVGNGTFAKTITTYAKEKGSDKKISAFIIDLNSPLIKKKEIKNKVGLLTVKNAIIEFNNYKTPKENLLGLSGNGLSIAFSALIDGRLSVAAGAIGVMRDCLKETIQFSKNRTQHGTVLAKKQLVQQHISQIIVALESTKWLVYKAATIRQQLQNYLETLKREDDGWIFTINRKNKKYSNFRNECDRLSAIAKYYATNACVDVTNRSVQIFGAEGYKKTSRVARHFLDSRATTIYEGTNEVLELKIATEILGNEYRAY
jgi:alkylation response protein AidB-like acyl-CoA dehydrogenase